MLTGGEVNRGRAARLESQRAVLAGGPGVAGHANRQRLPVERGKVGSATAVEHRRGCGSCHAGNPELCDGGREDPRGLREVLGSRGRADSIDRDPNVASGHGRERDRNSDSRVRGRTIGDGRHIDDLRRSAGIDPELGRHRVAPVRDDDQPELVEGHRSRDRHVEPLAHRVIEGGGPRGGVGTVERGGASRFEIGAERPRGLNRDTPGVGPGDPEQAVDDRARRGEGEPPGAAQREVTTGWNRERACQRGLLFRDVRGGKDRSLAGHDVGQGLLRRAAGSASYQVRGHLHDLIHSEVVAGVLVAEADFGEADRARVRVVRLASDVVANDGDPQTPERAAAEAERLTIRGARGRTERQIDVLAGTPAVEAELDFRDVPVAQARERLDEIDPVGGDGVPCVDLEPLSADRGEPADSPRGCDVPVENS